MINFEYLCTQCGVFEMFRPSGLRKHPAPCPSCGKLSARAYSIPNMSQVTPEQKEAIERNIKSQFEPEICGHDCNHEEHAVSPSQLLKKPKVMEYTGPRSWVIEHAR